MLSSIVRPRSEPAINAPYTDAGSRLRARRRASATLSNQSLMWHTPRSHPTRSRWDLVKNKFVTQ
jgi:hypothetical protein